MRANNSYLVEALQKTASENRSLKEKLARIEGEHKRLKTELHERGTCPLSGAQD